MIWAEAYRVMGWERGGGGVDFLVCALVSPPQELFFGGGGFQPL